MSKRWNRPETWLTVLVVGVAAVLTGIGGLWLFMMATPPLYPGADAVPNAQGQSASASWAFATEQARQAMREGVAAQNLPGASVAVGINGEIVWSEGFGVANLDSKTPVTPTTRFRIGTTSIPLTSAAVGLLLEKQQLSLDEEIQAHVPEFPKKPWPVTLRQVMGHVSGIRTDGGDEGPLFGTHCDRAVDAFPQFANADLQFEPGTQYRYSRFGWIVVSAAVEGAAGDHLQSFMRKHVFDPLGMNDTLADSADPPIENLASSYFPRFAADPKYGPDPMRPLDYSCYAGSSVFVSTPADLVRFSMAINSGTLLQPQTVQTLQTALRLPSGEETGYGLGWDLENVTLKGQTTQTLGHDGDLLGGIAGSLMIFRDRNMVVAILSNTSYADTPALALKVAEAFAK